MQNTQPLSADWSNVLARVETALLEAVTRLNEREQALTEPASLAAPPQSLDFSKFEERLAGFAERPQHVEKQLKELDAPLREGEEELRQWLAKAEAARRRLAAWVGRA